MDYINDPDVKDYINTLKAQAAPQQGVLNQIDPKWLALAQGFLAPTRTGGFGESLGLAAEKLQGPLAQMKQQQMSAMEKIAAIKETQARLALAAQKQAQDNNPENDWINNEYKRAQAINVYNNMYGNLRDKYMDLTGKNFLSPEHEAEFKKKSQPILDAIEALQSRSRPGGQSSIGTATGQGNQPVVIPNQNVTVTPTPQQPQGESLKEGQPVWNPQGIRFVVKNGKLVQDQQPGQR